MSTTSNVVQLDRRRESRALDSRHKELQTVTRELVMSHPLEAADGLLDIVLRSEADGSWYRRQLNLERQRSARLQVELAAERKARFRFTDEQCLAALRRVGGTTPVAATAVARALFPNDEPTHSAVIRVGHALGRLERSGAACRHVRHGGRNGFDWELVEHA